MQSPRTAHRSEQGPAAGRAQRSQAVPEPFGELEKQVAAEVHASALGILSATKACGPRSDTAAAAKACHLSALKRLSTLRPGIPLWQLERMALPRELTEPEVEILGLPRTRLPFSIGDVWPRVQLERELASRIAGNGDSVFSRQLARMLDRMVLSGLPPEDFGEFYRPAVSRLALSGGHDSFHYYRDLITNARALAHLVMPVLAARNASIINMSSHKDICTKTGDALAEPKPDERRSYIRDKNPPLKVARVKVGSNLLSRMGLDCESDELLAALSDGWGLPMRESPLAARSPSRDDFVPFLSYNISTGSTTTLSHPDLPGMEFAEPDVGSALALIAAAGLMEGSGGQAADPLAVGMLSQMEGVRPEGGEPDPRALLRCALLVVRTMQRAAEIRAADQPLQDACLQAAEDVKAATALVAQFRSERASPSAEPHLVDAGIRRMLSLSRESPDSPPFSLALTVIDEKRKAGKFLHTMIPASSLNEPPVQVPPSGSMRIDAPSPGPVQPSQADLAARPPLEVVPLPSPETAYSPERDGERADASGAPPSSAREEHAEIVPLPSPGGDEAVAAQAPAEAEPPEAVPLPAPEQAAADFDSERPTLVVPLIPQPILEIIPVQKVSLDSDLEAALPPNTDPQSAAVRHLSRYLAHCFIYGFGEEQMPIFLRDAYSRLAAASKPDVVRLLGMELQSDAPDPGCAVPHERFEQAGYLVRPAPIIEAMSALVRGTDFSALGRPAAEGPEIEVVVEEAGEAPPQQPAVQEKEEPPAAKPGLVLPLDNSVLDDRLEAVLPPKTDLRTRYIRHASRIIAHYLIFGAEDSDIPEQYRGIVGSLRGPRTTHSIPAVYLGQSADTERRKEIEGFGFSPESVVSSATSLVDGCDLSNVTNWKEYMLSVAREAAAREQAVEATPAAAEAREKLTLPVGNLIMDDSLEAALPPKTDRRAAIIRHVSRILGYYLVNGFTDDQVNPQYAAALAVLRGEKVTRDVPMKYVTGNDNGETVPTQGFAFVPSEVVEQATGMVDSSDLSEILVPSAPPPAQGRDESSKAPDVESLRASLSNLMTHERDLIAAVMNQPLDEFVLWEFTKMQPGRRELLVRQFVDSRWNEGDWKNDVERFTAAEDSVYRTLGLARASDAQKMEAIRDPRSLTSMQKHLVASLFNIAPSSLMSVHIEGFAAWVSGDQARISAFWDGFFVDPQRLSALAAKMGSPQPVFGADELALLGWMHGKDAGALTQAELQDAARVSAFADSTRRMKDFWLGSSLSERKGFWRSRDLLAAADVADKLRSSAGAGLSRAEAGLLSTLLGREVSDRTQLTQADQARLGRAFIQHSISAAEALRRLGTEIDTAGPEDLAILSSLLGRQVADRSQVTPFDLRQAQASYAAAEERIGKEKYYTAEILNMYAMGHAIHPSSLLIAARRESEFNTLLEFSGLPVERVRGRISYSHGISRPKRKNGGYLHTNDDSFSSAVVDLPDGRKLALDLVCDGMGGMDKGAQGPIPNGQIASNIAKDVFEMSAAAGWIRSPEDARKVVIMADLAVTMEQIYRKKSSLDQEALSTGEAVDPSTPYKQRNLMGTTMAIGLQDGRKFWGIHCGDSQWKVIRGDSAVAEADEHSLEYHIRMRNGCSLEDYFRTQYAPVVRSQVRSQWLASQEHAQGLGRNDPAYVELFERQVTQTLEQLVADQAYKAKPVVSAGLAQNMQYLHINNRDSGYGPIYLEDKDVIVLASDGVTVPICNHEFALILEEAGGDMGKALQMVLDHAESRINRGPHKTLCSCGQREGKSEDDKTLLMRGASEWFRDAEIRKKLHDDPRAYAASAERLGILALCTSAQTDIGSVKEHLLSFIEAAESAPEPRRSDAFTVAIATIFDITAERPEKDELLDYLAPHIGSWSGLLIRKLMKSPDFSRRKEAMLSIVARSVPLEDLSILAKAANPQLAAASSALLGSPADNQPEEEAGPDPIFRSQRSESGRPLSPSETRYLDSFLIDIDESAIVQETSAKLRVLPRDLEIMVFHVYAGFDADLAVNPHTRAEGDELVSQVRLNLSGDDAKRILVSSYLIYRLRDTEPGPAEAARFIDVLWKSVKGMDDSRQTPYALMFYNEALRLIKQYDPDDKRCFQG